MKLTKWLRGVRDAVLTGDEPTVAPLPETLPPPVQPDAPLEGQQARCLKCRLVLVAGVGAHNGEGVCR